MQQPNGAMFALNVQLSFQQSLRENCPAIRKLLYKIMKCLRGEEVLYNGK